MLKAVLLDCDGTLVDNEPLHLQMFQRVLGEEGISLSEKDYYEVYLGMDDRDCFRAVFKTTGRSLQKDELIDLIQRKTRYYEEAIRMEVRLFRGVLPFVHKLSGRYPLAVVSGSLRHEIEIILETAGIRQCFQQIVGAEDVTSGKPNPEGYLLALHRINATVPPSSPIQPDQCLVVEDSIAGIEAGKAAGMRCLAITNSYSRVALKHADRIVDTLEETTIASIEALFP